MGARRITNIFSFRPIVSRPSIALALLDNTRQVFCMQPLQAPIKLLLQDRPVTSNAMIPSPPDHHQKLFEIELELVLFFDLSLNALRPKVFSFLECKGTFLESRYSKILGQHSMMNILICGQSLLKLGYSALNFSHRFAQIFLKLQSKFLKVTIIWPKMFLTLTKIGQEIGLQN